MVEQSTGLTYTGAVGDNRDTWLYSTWIRMNMSYITGSHSLKVGIQPELDGQDQKISAPIRR